MSFPRYTKLALYKMLYELTTKGLIFVCASLSTLSSPTLTKVNMEGKINLIGDEMNVRRNNNIKGRTSRNAATFT